MGGGSGQPDAATTSEGGDGDQRKAEAGTRKGRIQPAGSGSGRLAADPADRRWIQPAPGGTSQRETEKACGHSVSHGVVGYLHPLAFWECKLEKIMAIVDSLCG